MNDNDDLMETGIVHGAERFGRTTVVISLLKVASGGFKNIGALDVAKKT